MKNRDYILNGQGKPCVIVSTGDSHHPSPPMFGSNIGFWVHKELYAQLVQFEKPLEEEIEELGAEDAAKAMKEVHDMIQSGGMFQADAKEKMEATVMGGIIKRKLEVSKAKHMLWEFNGIMDRDPYVENPGQIRSVAMFGERGLTEWSWADRNVKFYYYLAVAKFMNYFGRRHVYKNWEPGQWPVPWAGKGEYPIHEEPPAKDLEGIKKNLKDLEESLKVGNPDGTPKSN